MATGSSWTMPGTKLVKLSTTDAQQLAKSALLAAGYNDSDASTVCDHILDAQLRGYGPTGLARVVTIAKRVAQRVVSSEEMVVTRETPCSAQLDAKGAIGYLAAYKAAEIATAKAKKVGVGIVGVSDTFFAGMLSYYAEMATRQDLVCMISASAGPWVAPYGSYTPRFGTNPLCFGFPSSHDQPIIWDIGTSKVTHAQIRLAQLMGEDLLDGMAYDPDGNETKDPFKAREGAMAVWGGHKGSGLAIAVQLLGSLAGAPAHTQDTEGWGLLMIAMDPEMFRPIDDFKNEVDSYSDTIRSSQPLEGHGPVRMPFDRSWQIREATKADGHVEVEASVVEALQNFVKEGEVPR